MDFQEFLWAIFSVRNRVRIAMTRYTTRLAAVKVDCKFQRTALSQLRICLKSR